MNRHPGPRASSGQGSSKKTAEGGKGGKMDETTGSRSKTSIMKEIQTRRWVEEQAVNAIGMSEDEGTNQDTPTRSHRLPRMETYDDDGDNDDGVLGMEEGIIQVAQGKGGSQGFNWNTFLWHLG